MQFSGFLIKAKLSLASALNVHMCDFLGGPFQAVRARYKLKASNDQTSVPASVILNGRNCDVFPHGRLYISKASMFA